MTQLFSEEKHQQFTLWFSFDLKVVPQAPQSVIELEANTLVSLILDVLNFGIGGFL